MILINRSLFSFSVLLAFILGFKFKLIQSEIQKFKNFSTKEKKRHFFGLIISGIFMSLNWWSYLYVVQKISLKSAALAYVEAPLITAFLGVLIFKDRLEKDKKIALSIAFLGVCILSLGYFTEALWAILIAICYAGYLIGQKFCPQFHKLSILIVHFLLVNLLLFSIELVDDFHLPQTFDFWMWICIIVLFFTIIPQAMVLYANSKIPVSTVGILIYINPIIAFQVAIFYFGEKITTQQIIAYILLFLAVFFFNKNNIFKQKTI